MKSDEVKAELQRLGDPARVDSSSWFFKTGRGEYGEGDEFIGVTVPNQRKVAAKFKKLPLSELTILLKSPIHEHRLTGLFIAVGQYKSADFGERHIIYDWYLKQLYEGRVNNWDLVDSSAYNILGEYLLDKSRSILHVLAESESLWMKRASVVATYAFIKEDDFMDTLAIAEELISDSHDLIQKAVGWMLREVGNRDRAVEEEFLKKHYKYMPRTALRYSIEKFPEELRIMYLEGKV